MALYQSGSGLGALVGVGTTNPTSNLQVFGTPIAAGNVFSVLNTAASGNVVQFSSSAGTALIINASGNVGIGKTNPGALLDVNGALTATTISGTTLTASTAHNTSGSGVYQVAGTTVVDSSRNLTNIGTIGSGAITSSSTISGTTITGTTDASFNSVNVGIGSGSVATNTAIGRYALFNNTTGQLNTALGDFAMYYNTTGLQNTALGARSMYYNTTGNANTALGDQAMYTNTTGVNCTAVGNQTLYTNSTGQFNTAVGQKALFLTSTGGFNTALGERAVYTNTTGTYNTAVGMLSLYTNSTGNQNVAVGANALYYGDNNLNNTAVGYRAMEGVTGSAGSIGNVAVGIQALLGMTTGTYNVAVGINAMNTCTTGTYNVGIGADAAGSITTGSNNTAIGRGAGPSTGALTNTTCIGYNASASASNSVILGNGANVGIGTASPASTFHITANDSSILLERPGHSVWTGGPVFTMRALGSVPGWQSQFTIQTVYAATTPVGGYTNITTQEYPGGAYNNLNIFSNILTVNGSITATASITANSDRRIKTDLQVIPNALEKVKKISGYTFKRTDVDLPRQAGVIAQELLEVLPEVVHKNDDGIYSVSYGNIIALLIEALKEESAKREELEKRLSR